MTRPHVAGDMRGIRFEAGGSVQAANLPTPAMAADEVLVQVLAAGVCHTDLHLLDDVRAGRRPPLVPGHEIAGKVAKIGGDVYMLNVGDLVAVHYEQPCGACRACRAKRTNLCQGGHSLGFDLPGGYAEYTKARQDTVLALPPGLEPTEAATLGCSGATAYHAMVTVGSAGEGDLVVVLGAGGVGLSAIQVAKAQGARVLAVDTREEARKAATDAGADSAASPEDSKDLRDADVVVDFVGRKETLSLGRTMLGVGGRYVAVAGGSEAIEVTATDIMEGGRAFLGSFSSTIADLARTLALAEAGKLKPVVTRQESLENAATVLEDLRLGRIVGRAVLTP